MRFLWISFTHPHPISVVIITSFIQVHTLAQSPQWNGSNQTTHCSRLYWMESIHPAGPATGSQPRPYKGWHRYLPLLVSSSSSSSSPWSCVVGRDLWHLSAKAVFLQHVAPKVSQKGGEKTSKVHLGMIKLIIIFVWGCCGAAFVRTHPLLYCWFFVHSKSGNMLKLVT